MGAKTLEVNEADFQTQVLESPVPVLVDFWAEWCGPCKMIAPIVAELATEYDGKLRVVKIDADANPEILMRYGILSIPTLILFKGGDVAEKIVGLQAKNVLEEMIDKHV